MILFGETIKSLGPVDQVLWGWLDKNKCAGSACYRPVEPKATGRRDEGWYSMMWYGRRRRAGGGRCILPRA